MSIFKRIIFTAFILSISNSVLAVTFYQYNEPHLKQNGDQYSAGLGSPVNSYQITSVSSLGNFDNKASAVDLEYGLCLLMFTDTNYRESWAFTETSIADLELIQARNDSATENMDNRLSSFHLFKKLDGECKYAKVFRYRDFIESEQTYPIPLGIVVSKLGNFDNRASSVYVPYGTCLRVWKKTPADYPNYSAFYNSPDATFIPGWHNFNSDLHNTASSLELKVFYGVSCN